MTMVSLLAKLEQIRLEAENKDIDGLTRLQIIDVLLDYVNNESIKEAVEKIPC